MTISRPVIFCPWCSVAGPFVPLFKCSRAFCECVSEAYRCGRHGLDSVQYIKDKRSTRLRSFISSKLLRSTAHHRCHSIALLSLIQLSVTVLCGILNIETDTILTHRSLELDQCGYLIESSCAFTDSFHYSNHLMFFTQVYLCLHSSVSLTAPGSRGPQERELRLTH